MTACKYSVKFNSVKTIFCDSNFISNELSEKIVFDNDELDFRQYDYIVDQELLNCETSDKDSYRAEIRILEDKTHSNQIEYKYSAEFKKNVYTAIIECSN